MKEIKKQIGRKILELRTESRLTQNELAEKFDITPSYLGQVERGNNLVSLELLIKAAMLFNKTLDFFVFEGSAEADAERDEIIQDIDMFLSRQDIEHLKKYQKLLYFMREIV